jgi:hypothetical protein
MAEVASNGSSEGYVAPPLPFDVARAFTFFFEDPQWAPKLAVGSLCAVLSPMIIGTVFMMGYAVAIARRVRNDDVPRLPEWDDFQGILFDGLRALAISIAHKLPLMLLGLLVLFALLGGVFLGRGEGTLPDGFMFVGLPALFGGFLTVFLLALVVLLYLPSTLVRFVQTDSVPKAFDFVANAQFIRSHLATYALGVLAILVAAFISQFGVLLFCVGIFPAVFWSMCVMGYVVGELAKRPPGARGEGRTEVS